jgi:hypothetical protein
MIVYQVSFLHSSGKSILTWWYFVKCGFLWRFYNNYYQSRIRWIRWIPVVLQILCASFVFLLSGLIAANQGHTKAWKITTLSFFAAEYVLLDALYLWKAYRFEQPLDNGADSWAQSFDDDCKGVMCGGRIISSNIFIKGSDCVRCALRWNVLSGAIAWVPAIASLSLFLLGKTNYVISLWVSDNINFSHSQNLSDNAYQIDIVAAVVWIVRWTVVQYYRLMKDSNVNSNVPAGSDRTTRSGDSGDDPIYIGFVTGSEDGKCVHAV